MSLRTRNAAVLFNEEASEGIYDAPDAATDGILVEKPQIQFNPQNTETDEVTGSLDGRGPIVGGLKAKISFSAYLKGTGVPGAVPQFGPILKACGWGQTATMTAITGTGIAAVAASGEFTDSGNGLAALTIGTIIYVSGFATAANNGEFRVTASAAGAITVTKVYGAAHGLVNESAGASITIRRGIAGVAAASGTTTGFVAASPWAGTDQLYRGMPVVIGGNPATPALAFIMDYTAARSATLTDLFGSALSSSSKVSIPANVLWKPISSGIPAGSIAFYMDGVVYQLAGCRGTVGFEWDTAGACKANFSMNGMFVAKADAAVPAVTYDGTRPPIFRDSRMLLDRQQIALKMLGLDANNDLAQPDDPNQTEGFGVPEITARKLMGKMDPLATLVATRDIMGKFRAGTAQIIHARALGGPAGPGNRVALTMPDAIHESYQPGDRDRLAIEEVGFFARGQDSGAFLCVW